MKRIILVLVVLLGLQSYGIYGATRARELTVDCKLEISILCFDWEPNRLGRLLGESERDALEARIDEVEASWEREVLDRLEGGERGGLESILERLGEIGRDGLEQAREAADELGGGG